MRSIEPETFPSKQSNETNTECAETRKPMCEMESLLREINVAAGNLYLRFSLRDIYHLLLAYSHENAFFLLRAMQTTMSTGLGLTPTIEKIIIYCSGDFSLNDFPFRSMLHAPCSCVVRGRKDGARHVNLYEIYSEQQQSLSILPMNCGNWLHQIHRHHRDRTVKPSILQAIKNRVKPSSKQCKCPNSI